MKTSTPDQPKQPKPLSILLIGPPGGGKTTLEMQFPDICILDCNDHLDGPEKYNRARNKSLNYAFETISLNDKDEPVPIHERYDRLISRLEALKTDTRWKCVGIDSLTLVNEYVIQKILKEQSKTEMEVRHWQPFKTCFINLFAAKLYDLTLRGKTTICTCHEDKITKPDPKQPMMQTIVGYDPSVQGKVGDVLGTYFTDMWRCTSEAAPGNKIEFKISTVRTTLSDLKNSLGLPNEIIVKQDELAWAKLEPYLKGRV